MILQLNKRITLIPESGEEEAAAGIFSLIETNLTYKNPVYWSARYYRRRCRHIPKEIILFRRENRGITAPRGFYAKLLEIIRAMHPRMKIVLDDMTLFPRMNSTVDFTGNLRGYQTEAIEAAKSALCGVIQAPTGSGKTVIAMGLIAALKTPALIIVHTTVLLDQTAEKVRVFLKVEPAIIGAGKFETGDVTIAMVQTLTSRGYREIVDRFGLVILDEAHHCPAVTFKEVVQEFPAKYRIGLTATPTRKDRLHPVLYDTIGRIIYKIDPQRLVEEGSLVKARFFKISTLFRYPYRKNYQRLINRLVADYDRNNLVVETIAQTHKRKSLVLSERIDHCALLATLLGRKGVNAFLMTGKTAKEERDQFLEDFRKASNGILISTTSLIGEGFDLPDLDTIYLTVPNGSPQKTTQILGRVMRPSTDEKDARIFDFADEQIPVLRNQFMRRAKIYSR